MIRTLIVDDEPAARARLSRLMQAIPHIQVVGEVADGLEALQFMEAHPVDLALLDIEMPELDGLAVAHSLPPNGPRVIFITAFNQYAVAAFEAAAVDYLIKPVRMERLIEAIDRARVGRSPLDALQQAGLTPPSQLALKCGFDFVVVEPKNIWFALAKERYSVLYSRTEEIMVDEGISQLDERLSPHGFIRIHRSATVNIAWVAALQREGDRRYFVEMKPPQARRIPVSRDRLSTLRTALGITPG